MAKHRATSQRHHSMIFIFFLIQVPLRFLLAFFPETCGRCVSLGWGCIPLRSQHLRCVLLPHRLCSLTQGCVCLPEPCWILHSLAGKPTLRHQKPAAGSGRLRGLGERGPRETVWVVSNLSDDKTGKEHRRHFFKEGTKDGCRLVLFLPRQTGDATHLRMPWAGIANT